MTNLPGINSSEVKPSDPQMVNEFGCLHIAVLFITAAILYFIV